MLICSKKRYCFKNADGEKFITAGGLQFETAPDWLEKDSFFAEVVAEENIVVCKNSSAAEETAVMAKVSRPAKKAAVAK